MSIDHRNYGSRAAYLQNMESFSYHQVCLFRGSIWAFFEFWLLIFCPNLLIWVQFLSILWISTRAISVANFSSQFSSEATPYWIEHFLLLKLSKIYSFFAHTFRGDCSPPDLPLKNWKLSPESLGNFEFFEIFCQIQKNSREEPKAK